VLKTDSRIRSVFSVSIWRPYITSRTFGHIVVDIDHEALSAISSGQGPPVLPSTTLLSLLRPPRSTAFPAHFLVPLYLVPLLAPFVVSLARRQDAYKKGSTLLVDSIQHDFLISHFFTKTNRSPVHVFFPPNEVRSRPSSTSCVLLTVLLSQSPVHNVNM
jgi:hypothetical protein